MGRPRPHRSRRARLSAGPLGTGQTVNRANVGSRRSPVGAACCLFMWSCLKLLPDACHLGANPAAKDHQQHRHGDGKAAEPEEVRDLVFRVVGSCHPAAEVPTAMDTNHMATICVRKAFGANLVDSDCPTGESDSSAMTNRNMISTSHLDNCPRIPAIGTCLHPVVVTRNNP